MTEVLDRRYVAYGGAAELFESEAKEVLCESGAGTGKSYSLLRKADWTAREYPGCRQFFARDTRKSMNESVLVDWETKVLWQGHPAITGTASKEHRDSYTYPNGSVIVLAGLDNVDRLMSTQFDRGYVFEATETAEDDWDKMLTRLRNGMTPYHQLVADCNPAAAGHWLNRRFSDGNGRQRIGYRHEDNPKWFDHAKNEWRPEWMDYYRTLRSLSPVNRERLLYHRWVSAEGQVWPEYDSRLHRISLKDVPELKVYYAAMDFGYNAPGCLQVWGFDADERGYRVAEVYRRGWTIDQWAEMAERLQEEYGFFRGVADSARPDDIALLNKRLGIARGVEAVFVPCDKSRGVLHGIDIVRDALRKDGSGKPRLFLVRDALRLRDEQLAYTKRATCFEEEIENYVFRKNEDGKAVKDEPDPGCSDHACDSTRYLFTYLLGRSIVEAPEQPRFPKGSFGDLLDFEEDMDDEAV